MFLLFVGSVHFGLLAVVLQPVDMLKPNAEGKITEFKVMLWPLKAVNLIQQKMVAMQASFLTLHCPETSTSSSRPSAT